MGPCRCIKDLGGQDHTEVVRITVAWALAHLQVGFKHRIIAWIMFSTVKTEIVLWQTYDL